MCSELYRIAAHFASCFSLYDASLLTIGRKRVAAAEFLINESLVIEQGYTEITEYYRDDADHSQTNKSGFSRQALDLSTDGDAS